MKLTTTLKAALIGAALVVCAAPAAQAGQLLFTITGDDNASFRLDSSPAPDGYWYTDPTQYNPYFQNVTGTLDGSATIFPFITFYSDFNEGGVTGATEAGENGTVYFDTYGPQIYSGTYDAPQFATGVFDLSTENGVPRDVLTISAVPEPEVWALMMVGFFGVGFTLRAGRKSAVTA